MQLVLTKFACIKKEISDRYHFSKLLIVSGGHYYSEGSHPQLMAAGLSLKLFSIAYDANNPKNKN